MTVPEMSDVQNHVVSVQEDEISAYMENRVSLLLPSDIVVNSNSCNVTHQLQSSMWQQNGNHL